MANKRYFHSQIDGYKVKYTHDANFTNYSAYINGLGKTAHAFSLKEISDKVRAIIAANPRDTTGLLRIKV